MAQRPVLNASTRSLTGRKIKSLRRQGILPGNIFGKKAGSLAVQVSMPDFLSLYARAGETSLVDLAIEGEKNARPVLIVSVQNHPITGSPLHVDFHQVSLTEKVTANIPVEIEGVAPAVADLGGVLLTALSEVEVEALPTDLPDNITVNVERLAQFGDAILVKDLVVDSSKVTILSNAEETVVTVQEPVKAEEVEEELPTEAETTVQGKTEEASEGDVKQSE